MGIIWTLICVLYSLLMFALGGYGMHVFLEGPKQGTDSKFNVLMVGLTPFFLFAGAVSLIILIIC